MPAAVVARPHLAGAFRFLFHPPLGKVRYRVGYGGRGGAKSWQFGQALLIHAHERPLRVLCVREFQASMKDSVHKLLGDQIERMGMAGAYHVGQTTIRNLVTGSEFLFKGLRRDVAEIKSTEGIDVCWNEEAQNTSDESWKVLIPTIRKPGSEIWVSFNPGEATDPTYRRFVVDPPARSIVRAVGYLDNPWCPEVLIEEAEELRARDPEEYDHVWGGKPWTRSDTQILRDRCILDEEFTPEEDWDGPYYGADYGFAKDPTVLVRLWRVPPRPDADGLWELCIEYEAGGVGLDLAATVRAFEEVPGSREHRIRADSARPETTNELALRGFQVESVEKWPGSVEDGIAHLRSYRHIRIHARCRRARDEARLYRYKTNVAGDVLPKVLDANNHVWDAVRYALAPLIRKQAPQEVWFPGMPSKPGARR